MRNAGNFIILIFIYLLDLGCINSKEDYMEQYISAEIPNLPNSRDQTISSISQRSLHNVVVTRHVHTCNQHCKRDSLRCAKRFPVLFTLIYILLFLL